MTKAATKTHRMCQWIDIKLENGIERGLSHMDRWWLTVIDGVLQEKGMKSSGVNGSACISGNTEAGGKPKADLETRRLVLHVDHYFSPDFIWEGGSIHSCQIAQNDKNHQSKNRVVYTQAPITREWFTFKPMWERIMKLDGLLHTMSMSNLG